MLPLGVASANDPNTRTSHPPPQQRSLDCPQQTLVGLPGTASCNKAVGNVNDGTTPLPVGTWAPIPAFHAGDLLVVQARDIQQPVGLDGEN
jgi:hypothetical protein